MRVILRCDVTKRSTDLVKIVFGMTGFYFGGGDQDQLKQVLSRDNVPSPVLSMIKQRWIEGAKSLCCV